MISIVSNANEHVYRFTMNGLTSLMNAIKQLKVGKPIDRFFWDTQIPYGVLSPENGG